MVWATVRRVASADAAGDAQDGRSGGGAAAAAAARRATSSHSPTPAASLWETMEREVSY